MRGRKASTVTAGTEAGNGVPVRKSNRQRTGEQLDRRLQMAMKALVRLSRLGNRATYDLRPTEVEAIVGHLTNATARCIAALRGDKQTALVTSVFEADAPAAQ